ncbi:NAD(P)H-dependent oxidoreductase [Desulfopila sp. IMCC35008]|uniref:NAD(P)H-dependent oxidoreductase n=1 Tax=Desulfopila sp. IMCC35008 TaxID=2653858 RepID=UPI0013D48F56|nr:NAD(P)H-dependent oxidoreductase [Desulfopila sp. IMCC35008]
MKKILILFAHPAFTRSKINASLRSAVENLDNVTLHDLYSSYPDFLIDVQHEQQLCQSHDVIIFQHPFYWYSTPSLLKEWCDLVLEHDWAYGSKGQALQGKYFFQVLTAGGSDSTYKPEGLNMFTITELTSPFRATANLCGMHWLPPFAILGIHRGLSPEKVNRHAEEYRQALIAIRDEMLDLEKIQLGSYLNSDLNNCIRRVG